MPNPGAARVITRMRQLTDTSQRSLPRQQPMAGVESSKVVYDVVTAQV